MHGAHDFLKALAMVLCVAAVTTVVFQRLRQPVVLGYIIAGLIIGPHVPIPLVADATIVQTLSELGVILLMFSLGLEFSLRKLFQVGPTAGVTAVIQCSLMIWLGFVVGRAFGWTATESIFTGAIIAISSTTIIAKAFDEQGIRGKLRELVVGVLIVEDLIAILLMATLTAISTGAGLSAGQLALTVGRLVAFLVGLVGVGLLVIPRTVRAVHRLKRPETTLVASVGICFAVALLAQEFGYSVALGAFLAGSLVAESGEEKDIEHLVQPVRDVFAAVFFVSVGMLIDPALIAQHWVAVAVLTGVVILGKIVGRVAGRVPHRQRHAHLGAVGHEPGADRRVLLHHRRPRALAERHRPVPLPGGGGRLGDHHAHHALAHPRLGSGRQLRGPEAAQAAADLRDALRKLGGGPPRRAAATDQRREDPPPGETPAARCGRCSARSSSARPSPSGRIATAIESRIGLSASVAHLLGLGLAIFLALPFCVGVVRLARALGVLLAELALPPTAPEGRVDLAAAPRRALVVTLQLASILAVGAPLVAITQPFLPGFQGAAVLLLLLVVLGVGFWRSATNLQGHVRAGSEVIVEALARQSRGRSKQRHGEPLRDIHQMLPGLGEPTPVRLEDSSPAVGRTLAELNLRGMTGATVLAIQRGEEGALIPTAHETLRAGDVLALAGTHEAIDAARAVLEGSARHQPAVS